MDTSSSIYTRTPRGSAELNARQSALNATANSLLILIDGKRSHRDLLVVAGRLGLPADCLDGLETSGYIVREERTVDALPPQADFDKSHFSDAEQHALLYRNLIAAAKAHLGLKGYLFHIRIEKAVSIDDMRALIPPLSEAIAKARGLTPANEFIEKMQAFSRAAREPAHAI